MSSEIRHAEIAGAGFAGLTAALGRFETEVLATEENLAALADLSGQWIDHVHTRRALAASDGMSSKKKETGTSRARLKLNSRLAPMRLTPRSYFWICW